MEPNRCFTWLPQVRRPRRREALLSPAKPSFFQCLLRLRKQNHLFCNARRLGVLVCSTLAIFVALGASNHKLLLTSGDQVQQKSRVFLKLGNRSFQNCVFSHTEIHHTPLTSKSKEQRREETNLTIETCMYKIIQKTRCTLGSLSSKRSQPRRSGRSPLGYWKLNN